MNKTALPLVLMFLAFFLNACGGSDSNTPDEYEPGVFPASGLFKNLCEVPRTGSDINGNAFPDRAGSEFDEKMWLRSWSDEFYLWYSEIPDQNPGPFSVLAYFDELKTAELTPSGRPKDNFHFAIPTDEWLLSSRSGISFGYGAQLAIDNTFPRTITVVYTEPNSPATDSAADLKRGTRVLEVDGVDVSINTQAGIDTLNAGLFPGDVDEVHTFLVQDVEGSPRTIAMRSARIVSTPVQNVRTFSRGDNRIGYLVFNAHIATAELGLINAISELEAANIDELVIDLRYNGGGFLALASQFAYMIAGPVATEDKGFETLQFNDKYPDTNPFTDQPLEATPFINQTIGLSVDSGQALPSLNLDRVFVLTGPGTCSASESVMNGLRGVDIDVIQIGKTTCGKPYGFFAQDNCGTTWFSVHFSGVNDKGFGEYPDGFSPRGSGDGFGVELAGCDVSDDLGHELGDPEEARLAAALNYIDTGSCPASSFSKPSFSIQNTTVREDPELMGVPEWLKNRIMF